MLSTNRTLHQVLVVNHVAEQVLFKCHELLSLEWFWTMGQNIFLYDVSCEVSCEVSVKVWKSVVYGVFVSVGFLF